MRHSTPSKAARQEGKAATSSVKTALAELSIGEPTHVAGLTVFPLASALKSSVRYILLEDGLREGLVEIREVNKGGSVPDLAVENRSDSDVLIVDGEELVGAKQNRIANLTLLVAANRTTTIPVSCVEAGRWRYSRSDFEVSDRVQNRHGRAERLRSVHRSMRTTGTRHSDQGAVWDSIREKADRMEAPSPTQAMSAIYERHAETLSGYVQNVSAAPGQTGAIFVVGNRQFGLDLFDKPETFAAFLPKLVRSYAIDAMEARGASDVPAGAADARAFLDRVHDGAFDVHPAVALGHDVGIVSAGAIAGALVHEEVTVHLTAFSEPMRLAEPNPTPYASYRQRRASLRRRRSGEQKGREASID